MATPHDPPWRRDRQPPKPFIMCVTYTVLAAEIDLKIGGGGWAPWEVVGAIQQLFDAWPAPDGVPVVNLEGADVLTPELEAEIVRRLTGE